MVPVILSNEALNEPVLRSEYPGDDTSLSYFPPFSFRKAGAYQLTRRVSEMFSLKQSFHLKMT